MELQVTRPFHRDSSVTIEAVGESYQEIIWMTGSDKANSLLDDIAMIGWGKGKGFGKRTCLLTQYFTCALRA